jgi:hypothetical protein
MERRYFIATFWGRCMASCGVVFAASFVVTLIFGGGRFLADTITVPWFPVVLKLGQTGIWRPWPLALITLAVLVIAARWRWASLIATVWFLLNVLFALLFLSAYDGKS